LAVASNAWQADHWLDSRNNWHERWRGSISAPIEQPETAVREIEKWAGTLYGADSESRPRPRPSWGDPRYDPIWAAATKHESPSAATSAAAISTRCRFHRRVPQLHHDFMVTYSLLAANQVMSLILRRRVRPLREPAGGVREARVLLILPLMWRMDSTTGA